MDKNLKSSCTSELGAEVLMVITSFIIATIVLYIVLQEIVLGARFRSHRQKLSDKDAGILLSMAYALFLPLMSYMFSKTKQNDTGRAQVILVWMVFIEVIRVRAGDSMWELRKSAEQLVRLLWVGFLVYGYTPLHGLRMSLFILCTVTFTYEVMKGIAFYIAKDSYLIGRNPKLIHGYVKRVMLQDDLRTTPLSSCDYIVMGEEKHEIALCENGYVLGDKKSNSEGKITIGKVFQFKSCEDEASPLQSTRLRDTCLSFALAKMLRRRFVNLPLDEAGNSKALEFVQEGLINYIGSNKDIHIQESNGETNPIERVFGIIQNELKFVSEFLHNKVPPFIYFRWHILMDYLFGHIITLDTLYIICTLLIDKRNYIWLVLTAPDAYDHCFVHIFRHGAIIAKIFSYLDQAISILLAVACIYNQYKGCNFALLTSRWTQIQLVKQYLENPAKWSKIATLSKWRKMFHGQTVINNLFNKKSYAKNIEQLKIRYSIFDTKAETIFCINVHGTFLAHHLNCVRRKIGRALPTYFHSTNVKECILSTLKDKLERGGQFTNGLIALQRHGMWEHLNPIYRPSEGTTEAILIWHIATTLFHHQEPPTRQSNDPFKERDVALALSSYCHYLVESLPVLLLDEVEWTEKLYEGVREEIFAIDRSSGQEPTRKDRCNYVMGEEVTWDENSVLGTGAKLAKKLVELAAPSNDVEGQADKGIQVWTMLCEFWAEILLFNAASDNVKSHEEILEQEETKS